MKKLFLSSCFCEVSTLLPSLLTKKPDKSEVIFIPTAANPYEDKSWMEKDKTALLNLGFKLKILDINNKSKRYIKNELKTTEIIFVSGGNTYYLLENALESGFLDIVTEQIRRGLIYVGSSAGSILACPTIEYIGDLDDSSITKLTSFDAMNIVDFLILPHFGDYKHQEKLQQISNVWGNKYDIKAIRDKQAIIVKNKIIKIITI